ncbi:MAG: DUF1579 domain-containing protein [Candidatus Wallbacteria bacterium]|nr:DUF1579 domain-containing protein [Candidatus Wallbacteria bacterium]
MRFHRSLARALVLGLTLLASGSLPAAGTGDAKPAEKPAPGCADMAAVMKFAEPTEFHKHLAEMAGCWDATCKAWFAPGQPTVSQAHSDTTMILGGRFLQERFEGSFGGMPFSGAGLVGYDTYRKLWVSTWADTMGTNILTYLGKCDGKGRMTSIGDYINVATGKKARQKNIMRVLGPDKHVFEMYDQQPNGSWIELMEITYTRHCGKCEK